MPKEIKKGRPKSVRTPEEEIKFQEKKRESNRSRQAKFRENAKKNQKIIEVIPTEAVRVEKVRVLATAEQLKHNGMQIKKKKYETPEQLEVMVNDYFDGNGAVVKVRKNGVEAEVQIYTLAGLALHLGFKTTKSITDYEKKDEFADVIAIARLKYQHSLEVRLHTTNPTGPIFALKQVGWADNKKETVDVNLHPFIELMKRSNNNE